LGTNEGIILASEDIVALGFAQEINSRKGTSTIARD
jgi:hypothetical protein